MGGRGGIHHGVKCSTFRQATGLGNEKPGDVFSSSRQRQQDSSSSAAPAQPPAMDPPEWDGTQLSLRQEGPSGRMDTGLYG